MLALYPLPLAPLIAVVFLNHWLLILTNDDARVTEPPSQKVKAPDNCNTGLTGVGKLVIAIVFEGAE